MKFAREEAVEDGTSSLCDFERAKEKGSANGGFQKKFLVSNAREQTREGLKVCVTLGTNQGSSCKPSLDCMYI